MSGCNGTINNHTVHPNEKDVPRCYRCGGKLKDNELICKCAS